MAAPPRSHHPAPQIAFFIAPQDPYVSAATLSPCWQAFINAEMIKYWNNFWKLKPPDPVMNVSLKSLDTQYPSIKSWQNNFLDWSFRGVFIENVQMPHQKLWSYRKLTTMTKYLIVSPNGYHTTVLSWHYWLYFQFSNQRILKEILVPVNLDWTRWWMRGRQTQSIFFCQASSSFLFFYVFFFLFIQLTNFSKFMGSGCQRFP